MNHTRLLVVDDDTDFAAFVRKVAESASFAVETCASAEAFKVALAKEAAAVIILDISMPGTDGIELLRFIAERKSRARILILSGFDDRIRRMALDLGQALGLAMAGVVAKPVRAAELRATLQRLREAA